MRLYQHQTDHGGFRQYLFLIQKIGQSICSVDHSRVIERDWRADGRWSITGKEKFIYKCND